jgi:hypothetical protein
LAEIIGSLELLRSLFSFLREIRKEAILYHGSESKSYRVFHILDSLPTDSLAMQEQEANQLQNILLEYFDDVAFQESRIAMNAAKVICLISSLFINLFSILGTTPNQHK